MSRLFLDANTSFKVKTKKLKFFFFYMFSYGFLLFSYNFYCSVKMHVNQNWYENFNCGYYVCYNHVHNEK